METLVVDRVSEKRAKLIKLLNTVLTGDRHCREIEHLIFRLGLSKEEIIKAYVDYNLDIHAFGNEIYGSLANKMVLHIHNLMKKSWHQERQDCILNYVEKINVKNIIDVGFGVPSRYVKDLILAEKKSFLTLFDLAIPSIQFASCLLNLWDISWNETVSLKQGDMCDVNSVGKFDAYLFQDSIEHVPNPTNCLKEYVKISPEKAFFILSIPIGPIIKAHYMAWDSDEDAMSWLNSCGLRIIESQSIWINPNVDLFAEQLGQDHHNFIVLCEKI